MLQSGAILDTKFRVYESHIPFLLQFLVDYNLHGMGYIDVGYFKFRLPRLDDCEGSTWNLERTSYCDLELDTWPAEILNRYQVIEKPPGDPLNSNLVPSMTAVWKDEELRREHLGLPAFNRNAPELIRNPCSWANATHLKQKFISKVNSIVPGDTKMNIDLDGSRIPTVFQSIGTLHPKMQSKENTARSFSLSSATSRPESENSPHKPIVNLVLVEKASQQNNGSDSDDYIDHDLILDDINLDLEQENVQPNNIIPKTPTKTTSFEEALMLHSPESPLVRRSLEVALHKSNLNDAESKPIKVLNHRIALVKKKLVIEYEIERGSNRSWVRIENFQNNAAVLEYHKANPELENLIKSQPDDNQRHPITISQFDGPTDQKPPKKKRPRVRFDLDKTFEESIPTLGSSKPAKSELTLDLPLGIMNSLSGVWSPRAEKERKWSFDWNPPRPWSPSEESRQLNTFKLQPAPPTRSELEDYATMNGISFPMYKEPFYSLKSDIPKIPFTFANRTFNFDEATKKFDHDGCESVYCTLESLQKRSNGAALGSKWYTLATLPPYPREILDESILKRGNSASLSSQIQGPTQYRGHNFKLPSQSQNDLLGIPDWLTILSIEVFASNSPNKCCNAEEDPVLAIFYAIQTQGDEIPIQNGVICVKDDLSSSKYGLIDIEIHIVESEILALQLLIELVRRCDPDILTGYEIQNSSWGYLMKRAKLQYDINYAEHLSRIIPKHSRALHEKENDAWGTMKHSSIHIPGRIVLNVWRLIRKSMNVTSYTLENSVFHVLHERTPKFDQSLLLSWYQQDMIGRCKVLNYYSKRTIYNLALLDKTETINQSRFVKLTSEFARIYGIDLYSVIIRGSQYKVEAVLARITRPENYVMFSPSRPDVSHMKAPECLALNMEPITRLYTSPVAVLDFQSLYPSIVIAYNYCYSTLIGRVSTISEKSKLGCLDVYEISKDELLSIQDHVNISPNGCVFVKEYIRKGVLGRMLIEIIDTRQMIKSSMKLYNGRNRLSRILDAKQLGLKLLANVTYGYTSATFSGRMPCIEIADAIVQSGRESLEQSIELINKCKVWNNSVVVYGDTDSVFVQLLNTAKEQAFEIGNEISNAVTSRNPYPVKLKFEKIYLPSLLLAKKRYCGFMYEQINDKEPVFDAKGIETVRRDGCPAVQKILESCIKILFRTKDLSQVKAYLYDQWSKILLGKASIQNFFIAKEVKLGHYKSELLPPGAHLSVQKMEKDTNAEPEYGERVPYLVAHRGIQNRLIDNVILPKEFLEDPNAILNGEYYIMKQIIPPLERVFNLVGAGIFRLIDIKLWYSQMPKDTRTMKPAQTGSKRTIKSYYKALNCKICKAFSQMDLCNSCSDNKDASILTASHRLRERQIRLKKLSLICQNCSGIRDREIDCSSLDCPVYFVKIKENQKAAQLEEEYRLIIQVLASDNERI